MGGNDYYHLSDLTSKTFVSGLMLGKGENRRKIEDLLPQLDKKILLMKDFTTVLEKQKDERREIIAQLREIYDGMFSKKFGTIDKKVSYKSRFGMIAGVTPIIDKHWKVMQQLGERFLKYRWDEDEDKTTRKAEKNEGKEEEMRAEIKEAVMGFLTNLEIRKVEFPRELVEPLIQAAKFLALCRTPVTITSQYSDFYFDFIPTPERPTRLVKQLKKLAKCLAIVRNKDKVTKDEVATAIKVALHTVPPDRLEVLKAIEKLQNNTLEGCTIPQISKKVPLPRTSIGRICQQLTMLKLIKDTNVLKTADGYKTEAQYYKLSKEIHALSPGSFLDMSTKAGGDSAGVVSVREDSELVVEVESVEDVEESKVAPNVDGGKLPKYKGKHKLELSK